MADVELNIKVNTDNAEKTINKFVTNLKAVTAELGTLSKSSNKAAKDIAKGFTQMGTSAKDFKDSAKRIFEFFTGNILADAFKNTVKFITGSFVHLAQESLNLGAQFEFAEFKLKKFGLTTKEAEKLFHELQEIFDETNVPFESIEQAATRLLALGFNAEETGIRLKNIAEISEGTGASFDILSEVFTKVSTTGQLTIRQLQQLQANGVPAIQALSSVIGVSQDTIANLVRKGKIGSDELTKAFQSMSEKGGIAFNALQKDNLTFSGSLTELQRRFHTLIGTFGLVVAKNQDVKGAIAGLTSIVVGIQKALNDTNSDLSKFISKIALNIPDAIINASAALNAMVAVMGFLAKVTNVVAVFMSHLIQTVIELDAPVAHLSRSLNKLLGRTEDAAKDEAFIKSMEKTHKALQTFIDDFDKNNAAIDSAQTKSQEAIAKSTDFLLTKLREGIAGQKALVAESAKNDKDRVGSHGTAIDQITEKEQKAIDELAKKQQEANISERALYILQNQTLLEANQQRFDDLKLQIGAEKAARQIASEEIIKDDQQAALNRVENSKIEFDEKIKAFQKHQEDIRGLQEEQRLTEQELKIAQDEQAQLDMDTRIEMLNEQLLNEENIKAQAAINEISIEQQKALNIEKIKADSLKRQLKAQEDANKQVKQLEQQLTSVRLNIAEEAAQGIAKASGASAKAQFLISKAFAAADIFIKGEQAQALIQATIPYPANIPVVAAQASLTSSQLALVAATAIAGSFQNGGIVPGTSMSGDKQIARVNSGEMILNRQQQKTLFDIANNGQSSGSTPIIVNTTVELDGEVVARSVSRQVANGFELGKVI